MDVTVSVENGERLSGRSYSDYKKEILLSIIIPVYNAEKYIERCIISLLKDVDELRCIEIIVIDDGSTDMSAEICLKYEKIDSRIKFLYQENKGSSSARNLGIKIAHGKYISFIDADDYVENKYLQKIVNMLNTMEADMYVLGYKVIKNEKLLYDVDCPELPGIYDVNKIAYIYGKYGDNTVWNKVFKRNIVENQKIEFNINKRIGEDLQFIQDFILNAKKIVMKDYKGYFYNLNSGSVVANTKVSCFSDNADTFKRTMSYIEKFSLGNEYKKSFQSFMRGLTIESIKALLDRGEGKYIINERMEASGILDMITLNKGGGIRTAIEIYLLKKHKFITIKYLYVPFIHLFRDFRKRGKKHDS